MNVRWKREFQPSAHLVIRELELDRRTGDHRVGLHWYMEVVPLLVSRIDFGLELPEEERRDIVSESLASFRKSDAVLSENALIESIGKQTKKYAARPPQRYTLVTDWAVSDCPQQSRMIFGAKVQIGHRIPVSSLQIIASAAKDHVGNPFFPHNVGRCPIRVTVQAKSRQAAFVQAFEAQDLIRSVRNLYVSKSTNWLAEQMPPQPMSKVVVGPLHAVIGPGKGEEGCWLLYEPDYPQQVWSARWPPDTFEYERKVLTRIRASKQRDELIQGILRYNRALDKTDTDHRFLALWSVLEYLTGTGRGDSHDKTVKRAAFVGSTTDYDLVLLRYLKDHRNDLAHRGEYSISRIRHTFQLRRYVERLIQFLLTNSLKFDQWKDLTDTLDYPTEPNGLAAKEKELGVMRRALSIAKTRKRGQRKSK